MNNLTDGAKYTFFSMTLVIVLTIAISIGINLDEKFKWFQAFLEKTEVVLAYGISGVVFVSLIGLLLYNLFKLFALVLFNREFSLMNLLQRYFR